jgi:hypothetical protein
MKTIPTTTETTVPTEKQAAIFELQHAGEFTDIENSAIVYVLRGWFGGLAGIPGAIQAGDDAWAFTTLFEHFTSLMPYPPNLRTPTQVKILAALKSKAQASQDALDAVLGAKNNEDERMITETDAFVAELVKTL